MCDKTNPLAVLPDHSEGYLRTSNDQILTELTVREDGPL